jgi:hypothetical protein
MRSLKFSYLWVFLILFLHGKVQGALKTIDLKKALVTHSIDSNDDQFFKQDQPDDDSPAKRKRRARGVEVAVPVISAVSFDQPFTYSVFKTLWIDDIYISFLYNVDLKRGPPLS